MKLNDQLYQKYLEELQALENFNFSRSGERSHALKAAMDDPHTRHLVETLAFFSARNHLHGEQTITNLYRRLFRQYFPFLWSALPSMGMVQLLPSRDLQEFVECRAGTEISVHTQEGRVYFQTTTPMKILPIHLSRAHFDMKEQSEIRFSMHFSSTVPLSEPIGSFRLHINHLNHFPSSLSLSFALKQHLKKIEIHYDLSDQESRNSLPCEVDFAPLFPSLFNHPIETLRSKFHLPEQELFFDIQVPTTTKKWRTFTLTFHLGSKWPKNFPLSQDSFLPFVAPIVNLQRKKAEIIQCDGTKEYYPILYPNSEERYTLHSLLGVYSIEDHKLHPLKPGVLASDKESYEIEAVFEENKASEYRLLLDMPGAFKSPKLVVVEAFWHQPWFNGVEHEVKAVLANQVVRQINPRIQGMLSSSEEQTYFYDVPFLTHILSLKNQISLDLNSLLFLMSALKVPNRSYFKEIPTLIADLKVSQRHRSFSFASSYEYRFLLEKIDDKNRDLTLLYFTYMKQFLDLWLPNIEIVITLNAPNFNVPLIIKAGTTHETPSLVRNL